MPKQPFSSGFLEKREPVKEKADTTLRKVQKSPDSTSTAKKLFEPLLYDAALEFLAENLEGPNYETERGPNNTYGVVKYGIDSRYNNLSEEQIKNLSKEDAIDIYRKVYLKDTPFDRLSDPRDRLALAQLALNKPSWLREFLSGWQAPVGGDAWRTALLDFQKNKYHSIGKQNPRSYKGWLNRVKKTQDWTP